jgi:hypothetical protein
MQTSILQMTNNKDNSQKKGNSKSDQNFKVTEKPTSRVGKNHYSLEIDGINRLSNCFLFRDRLNKLGFHVLLIGAEETDSLLRTGFSNESEFNRSLNELIVSYDNHLLQCDIHSHELNYFQYMGFSYLGKVVIVHISELKRMLSYGVKPKYFFNPFSSKYLYSSFKKKLSEGFEDKDGFNNYLQALITE